MVGRDADLAGLPAPRASEQGGFQAELAAPPDAPPFGPLGFIRPYAYGLALGGEDGIVHVLRSLLAGTDLILAVDGHPTLDALREEGTLRPVTAYDVPGPRGR